jgi:DNA-binding transcriptional LysR family regulator
MNLGQLKFACTLAQCDSFTLAAEMCCVTQSTLSNGVAQLEEELGERIFVRTTRKVALTAFGLHILPYMQEVLKAQMSLQTQAHDFLHAEKKVIRIGTSPLVHTHLLAKMLEPFRQQYPQVELVLREMNMADLYKMLEGGLLDFVFGVTQVYKGAWVSSYLYEEPLLYIPRGGSAHAQQLKKVVHLKEIDTETYVMVPDSCGLARATRALFRSQRRKLLEYSGEAMSYQVLEDWAHLGIGAAILPQSKILNAQQEACTILDKHGAEVCIGIAANWLRQGLQAPHLQAFATHLQSVSPAQKK